jgi:hypothetical protein
MRCVEIEEFCENLGPGDYDQDEVSDQTETYNCIAYAAGETDKKWWPSLRMQLTYYWPPHLPREEDLKETPENFVQAFATKGYRICRTGKLEKGIEKIAIFLGPTGVPLHAARQLESGKWTSKCGDYEDIIHKTLAAMEGRNYGKAAVYMRRRRDGKPFLMERIRSRFFTKTDRSLQRAPLLCAHPLA